MSRQYRIGQASKLLGLPAHTLRFWEVEFNVRPLRSKTGQRVYTQTAVDKLQRIQELLHVHGMTIAGAKKVLSNAPACIGCAYREAELERLRSMLDRGVA